MKLAIKLKNIKVLAIASIFLFLIIPGREGWLDGIPLSQFHELAAILSIVVLLLFLPYPQPEKRKNKKKEHELKKFYLWLIVIMALLIICKFTIGAFSLPKGLIGKYYYPSAENGELQKSTDFKKLENATRLDKEINFKNSSFPLYFLNHGFSFGKVTRGEKAKLPFEAQWEGFLYIPPNKESIFIKTNGKTTLSLNGNNFNLNNFSSRIRLDPDNKNKIIPIKITYIPPEGQERKILQLSWEDDESGKSTIIESNFLLPKNYSISKIKLDKFFGWLDVLIKSLAIIVFMAAIISITYKKSLKDWIWSYKPYGLVLSLSIIYNKIYNFAISHFNSPDFNFITTGEDSAAYEYYARHIQLTNDWLMLAPEVNQIPYSLSLYYYFLSIWHYIVGESLLSILIVNLALLFIVSLIIFYIAKNLAASDSSIKTNWMYILLIPLIVTNSHFLNKIIEPYPYMTGTFLLISSLALLLLSVYKNKKVLTLLSGLILGLATLNRFNFLIISIFVILWLFFRNGKKSFLPVLAFIVGFGLIISIPMTRNWYYTGEFQLYSQGQLTNNFMMSVPIPENYPSRIKNETLTQIVFSKMFENQARPTFQWVIDHPFSYIKHIFKKIVDVFIYGLRKNVNYEMAIPFIGFLLASVIFLTKPKAIFPSLQRKDYILLGGIVWSQLILISAISLGEIRYYLPVVPIILIFSTCFLKFVIDLITNSAKTFLNTRTDKPANL